MHNPFATLIGIAQRRIPFTEPSASGSSTNSPLNTTRRLPPTAWDAVAAASIRAFLDGSPVQVSRATSTPGYIGFYLIEVQLPAVMNAGVSELHIGAGGQWSNHVQIVIEP